MTRNAQPPLLLQLPHLLKCPSLPSCPFSGITPQSTVLPQQGIQRTLLSSTPPFSPSFLWGGRRSVWSFSSRPPTRLSKAAGCPGGHCSGSVTGLCSSSYPPHPYLSSPHQPGSGHFLAQKLLEAPQCPWGGHRTLTLASGVPGWASAHLPLPYPVLRALSCSSVRAFLGCHPSERSLTISPNQGPQTFSLIAPRPFVQGTFLTVFMSLLCPPL